MQPQDTSGLCILAWLDATTPLFINILQPAKSPPAMPLHRLDFWLPAIGPAGMPAALAARLAAALASRTSLLAVEAMGLTSLQPLAALPKLSWVVASCESGMRPESAGEQGPPPAPAVCDLQVGVMFLTEPVHDRELTSQQPAFRQ